MYTSNAGNFSASTLVSWISGRITVRIHEYEQLYTD